MDVRAKQRLCLLACLVSFSLRVGGFAPRHLSRSVLSCFNRNRRPMLKEKYEFELFADYHQFYLQDEEADGKLSESWTEQAVETLLALAPGTIGVGTVRNMGVPVTIEILDTEPEEDFALWEQINECSIDVPSGKIVVAGCTDYFPDAARISVEPGTYRARVFYGDLDTLSEDGLDGDDKYKVILWCGETVEPQVLKRRVER